VDRDACSLTGGVEARDDRVLAVGIDVNNLASVAGGDTAHVVVDGGEHRDGLLGHVDTSKDGRSLRDTGETLLEDLGGQMGEVEVDVVLQGSDTAALADLNGHGTGDDVARGKVLGRRRIVLHKALAEAVEEVATLTTRALGDEAASAVDAGGVELHKLQVLEGQASTGDHCIAVTSASVGRSARKVRASITARGEHGLVRTEAVDCAVLHVEGDDTNALACKGKKKKRERENEPSLKGEAHSYLGP